MKLQKPVSVRTFEALNKRMAFNQGDKRRFDYSQLGVDGEFKLGGRLHQQTFPQLSIYDAEFSEGLAPQLDFIMITSEAVFLYDVKNFSGIHHYQNGDFYTSSTKYFNPLTQLDRAYDVLDILLKQKNCRLPIVKNLVFINPSFTLYGNDPNLPIILLSQLDQHFRTLSQQSNELTNYHHQIAEYIESKKVVKESYDLKIPYTFEALDKGVWCGSCLKQPMNASKRHFYCPSCKRLETKSAAVERSLIEFKLLFPNQKITPNQLVEWCGNTISHPYARQVIKTINKKLVFV